LIVASGLGCMHALGLAVCVPAAFALSVLKFRGRGLVFAVILLSFLIPFDSIAIPLSATFRTLQLEDGIFGIILPGIGNGQAIFHLRQFFLNIPLELKEAARLDGLVPVMTKIYVPLAKPVLIGAGLLLFVFQWQSYLWPLLSPLIHSSSRPRSRSPTMPANTASPTARSSWPAL
jgi:putative chitobiose transport system permease protein